MNLSELQKLPLFADLSAAESSCLEQGDEIAVAAGESVAKEGEPADYFHVIVTGEIRVSKTYGSQNVVMAVHAAGKFFGEVSLLLDMPYFVDAQARTACRLLRYSKEQFWSLMRNCPSVSKEILRTMAARLRGLEGFSQRREKLVSLGTMAAGLAHELNNPAAAARRAAADLLTVAGGLPFLACRLNKQQLSTDQSDAVAQLLRDLASRPRPTSLDPLSRADREEELLGWLEQHRIADAWKLTSALVNAGLEDVYVVGGANSAGQAAVYFARFARQVTMLVRGNSLTQTMSHYLIERLKQTSNIVVETGVEVAEANGTSRLESLVLRQTDTDNRRTVMAQSLFILIGASPHTDWLGETVLRDEHGFIVSGPDLLRDGCLPSNWPLARTPYLFETSVPGVFVAGDARHGSIKRVASGVGEGTIAEKMIERYLDEV